MTTTPALGAVLGLLGACGVLLILGAVRSPALRPRRRVGTLTRVIRQAGLPNVRPVSVIGASIGSGFVVGCLALVITALPIVAVMASALAAGVPVILLRRRASQRISALRRSWPDAVDTLAWAIRAGMSLPEALIELSRCGPETLRASFADFAADYRSSGSFGLAVDRLQEQLADPVADRVLSALRIARDVGGTDLGFVLRGLAAVLREDARTRGEIEGRQSWTVSAARLAVAAPWVTLALLCTRPEAVHAYRSAAGAMILLLAAGMSLLAYRLMLRIGRLPDETRLAS